MDLSQFNFQTDKPSDRRVYHREETISIPVGGPNTISRPHGITSKFVPILRYSLDAGTTWRYGGDPYVSGSDYLIINAAAGDTSVVIEYYNEGAARSLMYEINGIAVDV